MKYLSKLKNQKSYNDDVVILSKTSKNENNDFERFPEEFAKIVKKILDIEKEETINKLEKA